jgi:NAD(P)-dependent dehydrogenase (short-subunit alcohol dehydrogenase family)
MNGRLAGKVALVTGAASGIGRAIANRFAAEGAAVSVLDRDGEGLEETAAGIDADVARHTGDVTDTATVRSVVGSIIAVHGRLDVLSHSAGIDQPVRGALETDDELWGRVMSVNAGGTFVVDREAIRAMLVGGGGSVVNTVSDLSYVAVGGLAAYCASKGAALQLTRVLAAEYAPSVRVNALCPTMVDTPMARRSLSSRPDPDAYLKEIEAEIPMGRIAQVEDVTGAAVFLASDESRYVTGIALPIDGGRTIS